MSQSGASSQLSPSSMEETAEGGHRVEKLKMTLNQRKEQDEERERDRKRKTQENLQSEIGSCPVTPTAPVVAQETVALPKCERLFQPTRTPTQSQAASCSSTGSPRNPESESAALKVEIVELKEELRRTRARLEALESEKEEVKKQQRVAVSRDAQDEVAKLKQRVENITNLLEDTEKEVQRLRKKLRDSEDRIDELEEEIRGMRRRQTQEDSTSSQNHRMVQPPSPHKALPDKVRKLSTSSKDSAGLGQKRFMVTVQAHGKKVIIRQKGGSVPTGLG